MVKSEQGSKLIKGIVADQKDSKKGIKKNSDAKQTKIQKTKKDVKMNKKTDKVISSQKSKTTSTKKQQSTQNNKEVNKDVNYDFYAIVQKGHAQYVLHEGELLEIPRINAEEGKEYVFENVLAIFDNKDVMLGAPVLKGASVKVFVVKQIKGKKQRGFKYKAKSRYRKTWGYRNPKTRIRVLNINKGE